MSDPSVADFELLQANMLAKLKPAVEAEVRSVLDQRLTDLAEQEPLSPGQAVTIKQLIDARFAQEKGWKNLMRTWAPIVISVGALIVAMTQAHYAQKNLQNNLIYTMQKDQRLAILEYASNRTGPEYIFAQMQSIYIQPAARKYTRGCLGIFSERFLQRDAARKLQTVMERDV